MANQSTRGSEMRRALAYFAAFTGHILTHVESDEGMFGMVTALIVNE